MNNTRFGKILPLGIAAAVLSTGMAFAQTTTPATPSTPPATTTPPPITTPMTNPAVTAPAVGVPGAMPRAAVAPSSPAAPLNPSNNNSTTPAAVTTSNAPSKTAAAPVKGRNSFTMGEARRRITAGGFTAVADLRKDRDGIWRGKAMKDGHSVSVYCDYQGNVGAS